MKLSAIIIRHLKFKLAVVLLITASMAAFATLGDGGKKNLSQRNLLSAKAGAYNFKNFSLRSGYNYRGNNILNTTPSTKYIMLNTVVTYEQGNNTYILPMKRKVLILDKVKFNPR